MAEHALSKSPSKKFPTTVFVNQAGYFPSSKKVATITSSAKHFEVVNENGEIVYSGNTIHFGTDEYSGDNVFLADFSSVTESGSYYLILDNGDKSLKFTISDNVYDNTLSDLIRAFYYLRCGCELHSEHAGEFTHKECHIGKAVLWDDRTSELDVSGGWHDAGDYGRYVTPGCCALSHLLYAFKLFPNTLATLSLNIPKGSDSAPDFLSECRYELEWILKMQREDGGVYHKVTTANHAPFIMPEDDKEQLYVFAVSSMATADLSAVCALASGIYKEYDEEFSLKLMTASEKAYRWLEENPDYKGFRNPEGNNTGPYCEITDIDNRFWASCELYALTGDEKYHNDLKSFVHKNFPLTGLGYGSVGAFGVMAYLFCGQPSLNSELVELFKNAINKEAQKLKGFSDNCGYRVAMTELDYCWGSNMILMKQGMIFALADLVNENNYYYNYACSQFDYLLGVNATGYSYVSGTGEFCVNYPHLRAAHADGIEKCMPGMVSGGPNRYPCPNDKEVMNLKEYLPPMKSFLDDVGCYSLNEITIYWNSPSVFTLSYIMSNR